jgi:hypothetical protein
VLGVPSTRPGFDSHAGVRPRDESDEPFRSMKPTLLGVHPSVFVSVH